MVCQPYFLFSSLNSLITKSGFSADDSGDPFSLVLYLVVFGPHRLQIFFSVVHGISVSVMLNKILLCPFDSS